MATTYATDFTASYESQLDDLLMRICEELQLDGTRRERAEQSYRGIEAVLEKQPDIAGLRPRLYAQGSMLLGTTVKPLVGDQYDLDVVSEFSCRPDSFETPIQALDLIEKTLRSSPTYAPMVERKNRCIRLNYAHEFHLDLLPACRDVVRGGTCIIVPDQSLREWTPSNPKGFGEWFARRARQRHIRALDKAAEPLPIPELAHAKPPLKLAVQLLKRMRDVRFRNNKAPAPISVVLTTLAGHFYDGEQSLARTVGEILRRMRAAIKASHPRLVVLNPTNLAEDFSECWDKDSTGYRVFVDSIVAFDNAWQELMMARGLDNVTKQLEKIFGEQLARGTVEKQTREMESARSTGTLSVRKNSGIVSSVAVGSSVVPVPRTTFYGETE